MEAPLDLSFVSFDSSDQDVLGLRFIGAIDESDAIALCDHVDDIVASANGKVVLNFTGLSYCDLAARDHLVAMHARLLDAGVRCAYVADRSIFRGLASYIIHAAGDEFAKVFDRRQRAADHVRATSSSRLRDNTSALDSALDYMLGRRGRR